VIIGLVAQGICNLCHGLLCMTAWNILL